MQVLRLAAAAVAAWAMPAAAQDGAAGEKAFQRCIACHAVGEGAGTKAGPMLNGLDGRKAGSVPGYTYSEANQRSGLVWDEATFLDYIKDPAAKIPDTKMFFAGIKDEKEARDLWAYLKQFGPDGKIK